MGIILGEPTGISLKSYISESTAIDAALAWSFVDKGALHVHADFLLHDNSIFSKDVPLYYGIGGRVKFREDDTRIAVRIPVGVLYNIPSSPFDVFFELVPMLDLVPKTSFKFNGAVGGRFYF